MMNQNKTTTRDHAPGSTLLLSPREWAIAAAVLLIVAGLAPWLWQRVDTFDPTPNYRLPYSLANDYWVYGRYSRWASATGKVIVAGDSVIWGHYVAGDQALSSQLNRLTGKNDFLNLGIDGIHPVALYGLLRYYGRSIVDRPVVLHFNPLWMTSAKADLQTDKPWAFNHAKLVPQFIPRIPSYGASTTERIAAVLDRHIGFFSWAAHLRVNRFGGQDLFHWTLENPYSCPLAALWPGSPAAAADTQAAAATPPRRAAEKQQYDWVSPQTSLQWRFLRQSAELLRSRGNKVYVVVGPFNEHTLDPASAATYIGIKRAVEQWLQTEGIPYFIPAVLPPEDYCDASHPTAEGYALLAAELLNNQAFLSFLRP